MADDRGAFIIGWEEWLALPDLGLPAIKAKVDTGARTSALHAFIVEPYDEGERRMVRFALHPVPGREDIAVHCTAPVVDQREVASSNGERDMRFVIRTRVAMGGREWPIEITLANRETMAYRMLLGRQAIQDDMFVDASSSFRQPRLSHKVYRRASVRPAAEAASKALSIVVLTRKPLGAMNRRLADAAEAAGHALETVDPRGATLVLDADAPSVLAGRTRAGPFDAVIPRTGPGPFAAALVRQFEMTGAVSLNSASALDRLRNPLAALQALSGNGVPVPIAAVDAKSWGDLWREAGERTPRIGILVIGGRAWSAVSLRGQDPEPVAFDGLDAERDIAERAADALGLRLAAIDLAPGEDGPCVVAVAAAPPLGPFDKAGGGGLAAAIIAEVTRLAVAPADRR